MGVNPLKTTGVCQALPPSLLYSQPAMALSVMLVDVLLAIVGAAGAVCAALATAVVGVEVTLPVQLAAVTVTVIVFPISACAKV